eukprot:5678907-Prymnesium_polylepis.1
MDSDTVVSASCVQRASKTARGLRLCTIQRCSGIPDRRDRRTTQYCDSRGTDASCQRTGHARPRRGAVSAPMPQHPDEALGPVEKSRSRVAPVPAVESLHPCGGVHVVPKVWHGLVPERHHLESVRRGKAE